MNTKQAVRVFSDENTDFHKLYGLTEGFLHIPLFEQTPGNPFNPDFHVADAMQWVEDNEAFLNEFKAMLNTMRNVAGMSANQVERRGVGRIQDRFFMKRDKAQRLNLFLMPKIVERSGKLKNYKEGCFTWPGKVVSANRFDKIKLTYFDDHGQFCQDVFEDFDAQVIQHEMDHLNGIEENVFNLNSKGRIITVETVRYEEKKPGRNDPCSCGSGKKYKKCCGA